MRKTKLVLSGSGTRFPVFVGALKRLQESGYEFEAVCGTSGGSLVAAGLASGYSIAEMESLCLDLLPNLPKLIDLSLVSFLWKWGLIRGDKIEREIARLVPGKIGDTPMDLRIVSVNYDKSSDEEAYYVFSKENDKDIAISKAIRASIAVPLIFEPVEIRGDRYIDGAIGANFPLDVYGEDAEGVLGLYMDPGAPDRSHNRKQGLGGLVQYIMDVVNIFIAAATQEHIEDADGAKVIFLNSRRKSLDFFLNSKDVGEMIEDGYNQVSSWLEKDIK